MHIAIIGCGVVGGAYARALKEQANLSLCDIVSEGRPGALAREMGLPLHDAPGPWLEGCDFAIAAVPGRESPVAAAAALPFLPEHCLYVDVSTGAPAAMRGAAADFAAQGRDFVDTAILGAVDLTGGATPVLIAGEQAARAQQIFEIMGAPVQRLAEGKPGDAVALKLLRSVVVKNIECAAVECLTAADALGVRERLLEMFADIDAKPFRDLLASLATTHIQHAERRMHEMEEAAAQLRELGFDAAVTGALEQRYKATLAHQEKSPPGEAHASLDQALAWLSASAKS
ncbi:MAG: hypothetical protein Kow0032_22340 [Methyloligellaceae bacterium]